MKYPYDDSNEVDARLAGEREEGFNVLMSLVKRAFIIGALVTIWFYFLRG